MLRAVDHDTGNVQSTQIPVATPFYYSEREGQAYHADMGQMLGAYDYAQAVYNNPQAIKHMIEEADRLRIPIIGYRFAGKEELAEMYKKDSAKTVGFIHKYGEEHGDEAAIIKRDEGYNPFIIFNADLQHTGRLDALADAAIHSNDNESVRAAALMIKECGDGWGANAKLLEKLLVKSRETLGEADHTRFIANVAEEFEKVSGGQSLTDFLRSQHSRLGIRIFGLNILGTESKGKRFIKIVDEAILSNENSGLYGGYNMFAAQGAF